MNILSWNCQGLGLTHTVHELGKLNRKFKPHILFFIETKRKSFEMERPRLKWNYENCLAMDSIEKRGGLALLWNTKVQLEVVSFSLFHIDAKVSRD